MPCPYFPAGLRSFAVLGKGKSLLELRKYHQRFDHCFIVNNFDEEMPIIGEYLRGKNIVHFVNRLKTAVLTKDHYRDFGIQNIQYSVTSVLRDKAFLKTTLKYHLLGLKTHKLPKSLLTHNQRFGKEYALKNPNTGLMALFYALSLIKPQELWVFGMDFYQEDYVVRRPWANPIEIQREKMARLGIPEAASEAFQREKDVKIYMATRSDLFTPGENLTLL